MVLMFMYSDGGSFRAYRVFMFMYSDLWHIWCLCSCIVMVTKGI